jgi:branched-chain amino acid transport system permease protein
MTELTLAIVSGLTVGAMYALVGLGLVLIFRATGTFNFAHGQFMVVPAFLVGAWLSAGTFPLGFAAPLALAGIALLGAAFYRAVLQRITGEQHFMGFVATLGLAAILEGVVKLEYPSQTFTIPMTFLPDGVVEVLGARFSVATLLLGGFALLLATGVAALLRFTRLGTQVRAAGQDPLLASQGAIHVRRLFLGSWAAAAVLAGIAGIIYGNVYSVSLQLAALALIAFPAIILGGLDSIVGAVVGGVIIGLLQGFVTTYLGRDVVEVTTYGALLLVLLVYPTGLFGTKAATRV